jgi:hypothetical protein
MMHGSLSSEFKVVQSDLGVVKLTVDQLAVAVAQMSNVFIGRQVAGA